MSIRTLPGWQTLKRRAANARAREVGAACLKSEELSLDDAEIALDELFGSAPAIPQRATNGDSLTGEPARELDALLDRHGLRAIVATLRTLADSRCDSECSEYADFAELMEHDTNSEQWRVAADALEKLLLTGKVNAK